MSRPTSVECRCDLDGELEACIDGSVYVPCESENCGGVCELEGKCDCTCHTTTPAGKGADDG